jgi:glycosyltransferase involved in cell wall biosynthesis
VALITPSFEGGGVERVMLNLANGLAARGIPVDLVAISAHGPYREQVANAVQIVDLAAPRMVKAILPLARYLRRARPAAVLAALDYINVATICANVLAGSRARLVVSTHKYFSLATESSPLRRERWLLPVVMRLTYRRAHAVVAVADAMAEDLARMIGFPRDKITVVYNPAVTPEMLAKAQQPAPHAWLNPGGPPVLVAVGRLHEQKDFQTLLRAFALVRARRSARLIILGEGPERPALEAGVAKLGLTEDVDLPGFVPNPYAFMAGASQFVLSSRYEGLPTVLIEAMACGCPVVSTDCPSGPGEILDNGKYGRLVPVGDAAALAEAMEATLDAPPPAAELKARADLFHIDRVIDSYRRLLRV